MATINGWGVAPQLVTTITAFILYHTNDKILSADLLFDYIYNSHNSLIPKMIRHIVCISPLCQKGFSLRLYHDEVYNIHT